MNREVKVVLLGDSGVGKSSIVLRFCSDIFKVTHESTLGAAFMARTIEVNGINFKFQIWDTAGQEKYKSLTPLYYREAQVALIVYDITHKDSFDVLKSWVNELKAHGPKKIIQVLVGNKNDLIEDEKVSYDEANNYAQQIGASLKLTSCKENKGIQELFVSIAEQILYEEQNKLVEGKKTEKPQNPSVKVTVEDQNKKKKKEDAVEFNIVLKLQMSILPQIICFIINIITYPITAHTKNKTPNSRKCFSTCSLPFANQFNSFFSDRFQVNSIFIALYFHSSSGNSVSKCNYM